MLLAALRFSTTKEDRLHCHSSSSQLVGSCDFEPLDENCKIDDSFAAALMHFVRIAEISSALVTVPGYRYTGRPDDGTAKAVAQLSEACDRLSGVKTQPAITAALNIDIKSLDSWEFQRSVFGAVFFLHIDLILETTVPVGHLAFLIILHHGISVALPTAPLEKHINLLVVCHRYWMCIQL